MATNDSQPPKGYKMSEDSAIRLRSRHSHMDVFKQVQNAKSDFGNKTKKVKPAMYLHPVGQIPDFQRFPNSKKFDSETVEQYLENAILYEDAAQLMEKRQEFAVIEDDFGPALEKMLKGGNPPSLENLMNACSEYDESNDITTHNKKSQATYRYFVERGVSEDDAKAYAFAIAFYTGAYSALVSMEANVFARRLMTSNELNMNEISTSSNAAMIMYYLIKELIQKVRPSLLQGVMAELSSEKQNVIHPVVEGILQSLNLKLENNSNEYIIVVFINHDEDDLFWNLSMIFGEDRVKLFANIEESLRFINSCQDENIFLVISGTLGEIYAQRLVTISHIIGLYAYCMDNDKHATWTRKNRKIRYNMLNSAQFLTRIHADIKQLNGRWPFHAIPHRPQCIKTSYREMLEECRIYYKNSPIMLKQIDNFAQKYNSYNAIQEYTRETFLYRIINHALRTQNMEIIQKFSQFITDLHTQLHENYRKQYNSKIKPMCAVYRGQYLSENELQYLRSVCKSANPVIKFTTFCSASLDPEVSINFISSPTDCIPCLFEIIITDEYKIQESNAYDCTQAFADIASLSGILEEKEVLFSVLTHFRVIDVGDPKVQPDRP
ncbi:unnamed protein product [Rotaria magnacalcarata]|uniref:Uncharacterized protein n=5 Tax=Rotaria magnacalcarata TaxID=392030 RepID=A0A816LFN1_9BILA|nr:unnamed protein product [Rotaria magnacalcarata]